MSNARNEMGSILVDSATRMFGEMVTRERIAAAELGQWPAAIWDGAVQMGLDRAAQSEERGGAGGIDVRDLCALLRVGGRLSVPLPLAETWMAERLLAAANLPALADMQMPTTVGPVIVGERLMVARSAGGWKLSGTLNRVPWARHAKTLVVLASSADGVRTLCLSGCSVAEEDRNYANEPRDRLELDAIPVPDSAVGAAGSGYTFDDLIFEGALLRGAQMAGAMERILEMTVQYAKERVQFGRPIGKFQAVQQQIAVLAGQVAAASAAAHGAADAQSNKAPGGGVPAAGAPVGSQIARFEIACAKIRIGEAAGEVASIAHQVHGAMGFTREHTLQLGTRRLWAWRDEFGSEAEWSGWVGRVAATVGGESLWSFITAPHGPATSTELWQG